MGAFEGNHLEGHPIAQKKWRERQIRITRAVLCGEAVATLAARESVSVERIRQILQMACIRAIRLPPEKVRIPNSDTYNMAALVRTWALSQKAASGKT